MKYCKKIDSRIDKETFNWYYNRENFVLYPPIVGKINNEFYQLNNFDYDKPDVFIENFSDYESLLDFSFEIHGNVNIVEVAKGVEIAQKFGCDIHKLNFLKNAGIKGKKNINTLINILDTPKIFKDYITQKNLTIKYINLFLKLKPNLRQIALDFLKQKTPSIGEFRKLLNFLYDYSRVITTDKFDESLILDVKKKKNPELYDVKDKINHIQNRLGQKTKFLSLTNFETCEFKIEIQFSNEEEFENELKKLNGEILQELFEKLRKYDIC